MFFRVTSTLEYSGVEIKLEIEFLYSDMIFKQSYLDKVCSNEYNKKVRFVRDLSSAGRASALQAEGHRFEPYRSHFYASRISQSFIYISY